MYRVNNERLVLLIHEYYPYVSLLLYMLYRKISANERSEKSGEGFEAHATKWK